MNINAIISDYHISIHIIPKFTSYILSDLGIIKEEGNF